MQQESQESGRLRPSKVRIHVVVSADVATRLRDYCKEAGRIKGIFIEKAINEKLQRTGW